MVTIIVEMMKVDNHDLSMKRQDKHQHQLLSEKVAGVFTFDNLL
jgi:hypothetical protein